MTGKQKQQEKKMKTRSEQPRCHFCGRFTDGKLSIYEKIVYYMCSKCLAREFDDMYRALYPNEYL
jgi:hypothetical protein